MSKVALALVAGVALLVLTSTLGATPQVMGGVVGGISSQGRDPAAPQPTVVERRIPIGTSAVSGTVTNAEGRPVVGARVMVNGQVTQNVPATPASAPNGLPTRGAPGVIDITGVTGGVNGGMPVGFRGAPGAAPGLSVNMTPSSLSRMVMTDASGQFSFPKLPAGQFQLTITHSLYLALNYGQRRAGGPGKYIPLTDGQNLELKITMLRGAAISGTVYGPDGAPQARAQVQGWRYSMVSGARRLQSTGYASTDDRGMYRIFGLQPGDYLISATPNIVDPFQNQNSQTDQVERAIASGQVIPPASAGLTPTVSIQMTVNQQPSEYVPPPGYLPTFAPNSPMPLVANAITVAGNEEKTGVDVFVRLTQASIVQGEITMPADPAVNVQVMMYSDDPLESGQTNGAQLDPKGKFTFRSVRPGKYTILAQTVPKPVPYVQGQPNQTPTPLTDAQKLWGRAMVSVAGEPTIDVNLQLKTTRSISGTVFFEMAHPPDLTRAKIMVMLNNAPNAPSPMYYSGPPQAQVGADGRFTITGVVPGKYTLRANGSGLLKSAMVGPQDTLDFPLEFTGESDVTGVLLTMTDSYSELSGTLTDAAGKPASDYFIVVATTDNRYWTPGSRRIQTARPGPDGHYSLRSLPAGAYYLAVVPDLEQGAQYDPEFLRSLGSAAVTVTVMDGGKVQQDLRVK